MAIKSINSDPSFIQPPLGWKKCECTDVKIRALLVKTFVTLVENAYTRQNSYKADTSVLDKGFWYPNVYAAALKEKGAIKRLDYLRERNAFYHGHPPKGFASVRDTASPSGIKVLTYVLSKGTSPAEGLNNVKSTLCFLDCQELVEIAYYEILHEVMGQDKFNTYFAAGGEHPLTLDLNLGLTPLTAFLSISHPLNKPQLGDHLIFLNPPFYSYRHRQGEAKGYHAFCIEEGTVPKFTSFGLNPKGLTEEEMLDTLVEEFNIEPIKNSTIITPELEKKITETYAKDNASIEMREAAKKMTITKEAIRDVQKFNPHLAGLKPEVLSCFNIEKLQSVLD